MTRRVIIFSSRMIATAFLMLICAAAQAASPHRYEVSVDDSLDTALEQLSRCCASEERRWNAQEIIVRLDAVTGTTVFSDLVRAQFEAEGFPDYEAVLVRAGVKVEGTQVEFNASAPWAAERDALMQPAR
jgi:hypothetical protein